MELIDIIKEHMCKHGVPNKKLAEITGLHSATISKILNKKARLSFVTALDIVRELLPEKEEELMGDYALTVTKEEELKEALEYCTFHSLEQKVILIDKIDRIDKEWSFLYKVGSSFELSPGESLEEIYQFHIKSPEMKAYQLLLRIILHYEERDFVYLDTLSTRLMKVLRYIKSDFLRNSYKIRLKNMQALAKLHNNEIEEARIYAQDLATKNLSKLLKGSCYQIIGETYMFIHYDKAREYFEKAHQMYMKKYPTARWALWDINYLNFIWGEEPEYLLEKSNNPIDMLDLAYYHIIRKENRRALNYIENIKLLKPNEQMQAFYNHCLYFIYSDDTYLYQSIEHFQNIKDRYFRKTVLIELQKLGVNKNIIYLLSK